MNFGSILQGAQNFLGNAGKAIAQTFSQPSRHTGTGGGLVPRLASAASSFLQPRPIAPPARAQVPTPQAPVQPRQLPQLPPAATKPAAFQGPSQVQSTYQSTYRPPAQPQFQGPSLEEAAARFNQERMDQYAKLVAPHEQAISAYLASRKPYEQVYGEQQAAQGIPDKQKLLSGLESDILKQQEQLETLPKEDIARRSDTGMLSESARRRVQAMEERPIREQLLKTAQAQQGAEVGYNRALQLAREGAQAYGQTTEEGLRPLQATLDTARAQFGQVADSIAQQLTGFTADREAALRQYEQAVQQGFQLDQTQAQQASQLKREESQHVQTMAVVGSLTRDVQGGQTLNSVMGKYLAQGLDPDMILSLYNSYSPYGVAKEGAGTLSSRYGVGTTRFGGSTAGSYTSQLLGE